MSAVEEKELKAGHAPAVKAGGMRITQKRTPSESEKNPPAAAEGEEEPVEESEAKSDKHKQELLLSGVVTKGDRDFTADAVKNYHEKPLPSKDFRPVNKPHVIQQPRQ